MIIISIVGKKERKIENIYDSYKSNCYIIYFTIFF